jgi:hypothetical protein
VLLLAASVNQRNFRLLQNIWLDFVFGSPILQNAIFGVLGALLGAPFLKLLGVSSENKHAIKFLSLICVLFVASGNGAMSLAEKQLMPKFLDREFQKIRLYQVMSKHYPREYKQALDETLKVTLDPSVDDIEGATASATSLIIAPLVEANLQKGSSGAIFELMKASNEVMKIVSTTPDQCRDFTDGKVGPWTNAVPESVQLKLVEARTSILESAAIAPIAQATLSPDQISQLLILGYNKIGIRPSRIDEIATASQGSSVHYCKVMSEFSDALIALGPTDGSKLYRGLFESAQ